MLLGSSSLGRRVGTPVWRRQLGRSVRPSLVWVGAFAAALLLGLTVAAGRLTLASVANAAFADEYGSYRSPLDVGLNFTASGFLRPDVVGEFLPPARGLAADDFVAPPVVTISAPEQGLATTLGGAGRQPAQLFVRDGAVEHLPGRSDAAEETGGGWWIAESTADVLGVSAGDTLWLGTFGHSFPIQATGNTAPVRITGTYRDLHEVLETSYWEPVDPLPAESPIQEYWGPFAERVVRLTPEGVAVLPRMIVAAPETLAAADWGDDLPLGRLHVAYPPAISGERLDEGRRSLAALSDVQTALMSDDTPAGAAVRPLGVSGQNSFVFLENVIDFADETSTLVGASTGPLVAAIQVVGFLVVVAAGVYLARLRGGELRLLRSQGLGPRTLAAYTTLELLLPAALGGVAGWGIAVLLVTWLGPAAVDSAELLRATALLVVAVVLTALLAMWLAVTVLMWAAEREAHPLHRASRWRWEIPIVVLAGLAGYQAATRGTAIVAGPEGPEVDGFIVAFPLLALLAAAALAVRVTQILLPRIRGTGRPTSRARFLAGQRLAAARVPALVYVGSSVAALGVLVYALVAQQSLDRTIDAKITTIVGADATVEVQNIVGTVDPGPFRSTTVFRDGAEFSDGSRVDILAVDPATFADVAGTHGAVAGAPLAEFIDDLERGRSGRVGALLVDGDRSGVVPISPRGGGSWTIEVDILDRVGFFPGANSRDPTLVVSVDRYVDAVRATQQSSIDYRLVLQRNRELWLDGDEQEIIAHLAAFGIPADHVRTAGGLRRDPSVAAVAWTVDILFVIGLGGAVLALVGAGIYLYTRQDARLFSYLLLRKMGLSRRRHLAALVLEVGAVLGAGLVLGAVVGAVTARFMALRLDPLPDAPGLAQFSVPYARIGLVVLACALGCVAAAWLVQRASDRARAAELLRQGDPA